MATPTCSLCTHPHRSDIDGGLQAAVPLREIAQRFRVGRSTLGCHKAHLALQSGAVPARDTPARDPAPPGPLLPTVAQAQAHPDAYAVYRHKANGGEGVPSHLRGQAVEVRKRADDIVLFQKVVDPVPADVDRLRHLTKDYLRRELTRMARAEVRKSAELRDWDDGAALDVLLSYRQDLYRSWQEKKAA